MACAPDAYETDDTCAAARWMAENAPQARTFCNAANPSQPDLDWVKFTAFAGANYTLAATNAAPHANPQVSILNRCDGATLAGPAAAASWTPATSGVYVARLERGAGTVGPLTAYSLTLSAATGVTDDYEPDNTCAAARDIATNGARQTHRFVTPGDEDWIRFPVRAGESFIVVADKPGPGVSPQIALFASCDEATVNQPLAAAAEQVNTAAATDQVYVARIKNSVPGVYGAAAVYDVAVYAATCTNDSFEEDDTPAQAAALAVGGAAQTHTFCPARDEDWANVEATADQVYVVRTTNLGAASDTVLQLYAPDGVTLLAENDDYGYTRASRIVFRPAESGAYRVRVRHHNIVASGAATQYDLVAQQGFCMPDSLEGSAGDNGPGDAMLLPPNSQAQTHSFCADPLRADLGDQDWLRFTTVVDGDYQIQTAAVGANSDTVLELYDQDGATRLQSNDDIGLGGSARVTLHASAAGTYYVRAIQYNSNMVGAETDYQVALTAVEPTPIPTPTPTPLPTPTPTPTPDPAGLKTLIVVNRAQMATLYAPAEVDSLLVKLYALADHPRVKGMVVQVENDPAIASAYAAWNADASALADVTKANAVAGAVRGRILAILNDAPNLRHVVLVGDDRVIPFRHVPSRVTKKHVKGNTGIYETEYITDVTASTTIAAALAQNMVLTDNYYVDREPGQWTDTDHNNYELYLPDMGYAVSRLVETPAEMRAFIDNFLARPTLPIDEALVTGYAFVRDAGDKITSVLEYDNLPVNHELVTTQPSGCRRPERPAARARSGLRSAVDQRPLDSLERDGAQ